MNRQAKPAESVANDPLLTKRLEPVFVRSRRLLTKAASAERDEIAMAGPGRFKFANGAFIPRQSSRERRRRHISEATSHVPLIPRKGDPTPCYPTLGLLSEKLLSGHRAELMSTGPSRLIQLD